MRNILSEYVTVIDLSRIYGVTARRIRAIADNRGIVGERVGRTLVFKKTQVVQFRPHPCGQCAPWRKKESE